MSGLEKHFQHTYSIYMATNNIYRYIEINNFEDIQKIKTLVKCIFILRKLTLLAA